jgi:hypothetical protein
VPELLREDESSWTKQTMRTALNAIQTLLMEGLGDWERACTSGELGIKYLVGKQRREMGDDSLYL